MDVTASDRVRKHLRRTLRDFVRSASDLITFEVLFKLAAAALLTPLTAAFVSRLISLSGNVALSNEQIAAFLLSPLGIVTAGVWLVIIFSIWTAELAGLFVIAGGGMRRRPKGAISAIAFVVTRARRLIALAALQLAVFAAVLLPLLGVAAGVYLALLGQHDINFYLDARPPEFLAAVAIGVALAAIAAAAVGWLHVRWLFAVPACMLDECSYRDSLRESYSLTRGSFWRLAAVVVAWLILVAAAGGGFALILNAFSRYLLSSLATSLTALVVTMGGIVAMYTLLSACLSFIGVTGYALIVARLYQAARLQHGQAFATALPARQPDSRDRPTWLTTRRFAYAVVIAFGLLMSLAAHAIVERVELTDRVAVTAHRGSSLRAPENSLAAIDLGIQEGAEFIEIDVQETADGAIVALHDKDFKRLAGDDRKIWETTLAELAEIDIGSKFDPQFADQRAPTLAEVMAAVRGHAKLNIELKYNGHDKDLARRVVEVIRREQFENDCVISSLNQDGLQEVRAAAPDLKIGIISAVSIGRLARADADFLSVSSSSVNSSLVDAAHREGKQVHVWTVNDVQDANRVIDMGVDNVLTDDPKLIVDLIEQRAQLSPQERLLLSFRQWLGL